MGDGLDRSSMTAPPLSRLSPFFSAQMAEGSSQHATIVLPTPLASTDRGERPTGELSVSAFQDDGEARGLPWDVEAENCAAAFESRGTGGSGMPGGAVEVSASVGESEGTGISSLDGEVPPQVARASAARSSLAMTPSPPRVVVSNLPLRRASSRRIAAGLAASVGGDDSQNAARARRRSTGDSDDAGLSLFSMGRRTPRGAESTTPRIEASAGDVWVEGLLGSSSSTSNRAADDGRTVERSDDRVVNIPQEISHLTSFPGSAETMDVATTEPLVTEEGLATFGRVATQEEGVNAGVLSGGVVGQYSGPEDSPRGDSVRRDSETVLLRTALLRRAAARISAAYARRGAGRLSRTRTTRAATHTPSPSSPRPTAEHREAQTSVTIPPDEGVHEQTGPARTRLDSVNSGGLNPPSGESSSPRPSTAELDAAAARGGIDAERARLMLEIAHLRGQQNESLVHLLRLQQEQFLVRQRQVSTLSDIVDSFGRTVDAAWALPHGEDSSLGRISGDVVSTLRRMLRVLLATVPPSDAGGATNEGFGDSHITTGSSSSPALRERSSLRLASTSGGSFGSPRSSVATTVSSPSTTGVRVGSSSGGVSGGSRGSALRPAGDLTQEVIDAALEALPRLAAAATAISDARRVQEIGGNDGDRVDAGGAGREEGRDAGRRCSAETIAALPDAPVSSEGSGDGSGGGRSADCVICLVESGSEAGSLCHLPCDHVFHRICVGKWLSVQASCPTCRREVPNVSSPSPVAASVTAEIV